MAFYLIIALIIDLYEKVSYSSMEKPIFHHFTIHSRYLAFMDDDEKVKFDNVKATTLNLNCPTLEQPIPE